MTSENPSLNYPHPPPAPVADDAPKVHAHHEIHAVPRRILLGVYFSLLFFTMVTVLVSRINLGNANIWVALGVAIVKSSLVALYFMHLRWDSPFNGVVLIAAFFFVSLFIGLALLDSHSYQPIMKPTPTAHFVQ